MGWIDLLTISILALTLGLLVIMLALWVGDAHNEEYGGDAKAREMVWIGLLKISRPLRQPFLLLACKRFDRRRDETLYLTGYKVAFVEVGLADGYPNDQMRFAPGMGAGFSSYTADDVAQCDQGHSPPLQNEAWCRCGFHALKLRRQLGRTKNSYLVMERSRRAALVLLEVDLSGTVFENQLGYRAEKQRVLKVHFGRACVMCRQGFWTRKRPATDLALVKYERRQVRLGDHHVLAPVCAGHLAQAGHIYTLPQVANRLGTEVAWQ